MQAWQLACVPIACSTFYNVFNSLKPRLAHKQRHPTKCSHASIFSLFILYAISHFCTSGAQIPKARQWKGVVVVGWRVCLLV